MAWFAPWSAVEVSSTCAASNLVALICPIPRDTVVELLKGATVAIDLAALLAPIPARTPVVPTTAMFFRE